MNKFITSPYNFVELSDEIIFPDWAKQVSHDIPFSDGLDGELEIKVEAVTPVYIRDSASKKNEERSPEFFKCEGGKYYIPGTSLKGMVRNVLEIASYGKMQHVANKRYAIRDLQSKAYTDLFITKDMISKVKAGFLDISTPDWKIYPCEYAMFPRSAIDPVFGNKRMAASQKYKAYLKNLGKTLTMRADVSWFDKTVQPDFGGVPYNRAYFNPAGAFEGVLVFTGQPQDFIEGRKGQKRNEFFFYNVSEQYFYVDDPETLETDEYGELIRKNQQDFRFVHCEQTVAGDFKEWESGELKVVREKYFNGRIPIFYLQNNNYFRFGLAYLFRFAGVASTVEALRNTNPDHYAYRNEIFQPDLADLIFGYATAESSLRGRVQFTACLAENIEKSEPKTYQIVPGSPKPSFYPAYLQQKGENYQTFLNSNAKLSGWKRYPALGGKRDFSALVQNDEPVQNQNMQVVFTPLPEKTTFAGKIRFHNLRPIELGALIWSLKLQNPDYYCHTIGMAKPYGFGRVKIHIQDHPFFTEERQKDYTEKFKAFVWNKLKETETYSHISNFQNLPQIEMLLRMALYDNRKIESGQWCFKYPDLNDFAEIKKEKQVLGEYPDPATERSTTAAPVVREKSCEEKFLEALPKKLEDCVKMLKDEAFANTKFSEKQIEEFKNKYPELKRKYYVMPTDCKEFNTEIEKHKA